MFLIIHNVWNPLKQKSTEAFNFVIKTLKYENYCQLELKIEWYLCKYLQ